MLGWVFSTIFSWKAFIALLIICCLGLLQTNFLLKGSRLMIQGGLPDNEGLYTLLTLKRAHQVRECLIAIIGLTDRLAGRLAGSLNERTIRKMKI